MRSRGLLYKADKSKKRQDKEFYQMSKKVENKQKKTKKLKNVKIFIFKLKYTLLWLIMLLFLSGIMGGIITFISILIKI